MKNCKKCGADCTDESTFCSNCGEALKNYSKAVEAKKKFDINKSLNIVNYIIAAFLIILGIVLFPGGIIAILGAGILIISTISSSKKINQIPIIETERNEAIKELDDLKATFTPEMTDYVNLKKCIDEENKTFDEMIKTRNEVEDQIEEKCKELNNLKKQIIETTDEIQMQEFGLYKPKYDFSSSEIYKDRISKIREKQKELIKSGRAVTGNMNWTVNNNVTQGKKMVKDMQKLLIRAFNSECDELIDKVKFNTFDTAVKRMRSSRDNISKLGTIMQVSITAEYYNAKYEELCLALEYRKKKQDEKEEQKEIRARMREEAKLQKEIEEARKKVQKEQSHYENALEKINQQIAIASEDELQALNDKKSEILAQLGEIEKAIKDIDYREANAKAGYVYIISNIGSFGENIYKIGMTRRLEPLDRVDELGDASVPFDFDVHAMIFSDNAPALEAALHKAFENKKLNMINKRREFFNVTLDEIEAVVKKNYDKTVDFIRIPDAEQYRESMKIKQESYNKK